MATPIYKSFMGHMNEAWYALSEQDQQALMARLAEASERVGQKVHPHVHYNLVVRSLSILWRRGIPGHGSRAAIP